MDLNKPLAFRMSPKTLEDYVGQEHILGKDKILYRTIKADRLSSIILWGPPGCGKTSLARVISNTTKYKFTKINAVTAGIGDIKNAIEEAKNTFLNPTGRCILFIDEIHRFNKLQQDALLPYVENGTVILIGATTENPYFEVNKALISRSMIFKLNPLTVQNVYDVLKKSLISEEGLGSYKINIEDERYPNKLRNIYDPPKKLYVLGNGEILKNKGIAIVGSRKATDYGKKVTLKISTELVNKEINIISGLAIGIDSYAHMGALIASGKGKTIAVLGSGIDEIYPKENTELARKIIQTGGCIVSEYPLGTKPNKINFPQRNRIISGLSDGVVVVEATKSSGSLITAEFGMEQGREIFAVPGNIFNPASEGTNELIRDGATIVLSSKEIIEEIK